MVTMALVALPAVAAAQQDTAAFDGRSTQDTVRVVVGSLVGLAGVVFVLLLVYVWHTSPRRRLRVALRRLDAEETLDEGEDGMTAVARSGDGTGGGVALEEMLAELGEAAEAGEVAPPASAG